jgi:twitching motility protein PilJ
MQADLEEISRFARALTMEKASPSNIAADAHDARAILGLLELHQRRVESLEREVEALCKSADRMDEGAHDQARTVSRTTGTVESLSAKIDQISVSAEEAAKAGEQMRLEAHAGFARIQQIIAGMNRLRTHVDANGRKARRLGDRSEEIGTIVDLISGISSRTDMLALNATIESVRAGEHGRGFSVVAEEIRKLAERTATATREIGTLVEAIQADAHESIRALAEQQAEMEAESNRVNEAGAALNKIGEFAERSASLAHGISHSANDQVSATQELVQAMQQIAEASQLILGETTRFRAHAQVFSAVHAPAPRETRSREESRHRTHGTSGSRRRYVASGSGR